MVKKHFGDVARAHDHGNVTSSPPAGSPRGAARSKAAPHHIAVNTSAVAASLAKKGPTTPPKKTASAAAMEPYHQKVCQEGFPMRPRSSGSSKKHIDAPTSPGSSTTPGRKHVTASTPDHLSGSAIKLAASAASPQRRSAGAKKQPASPPKARAAGIRTSGGDVAVARNRGAGLGLLHYNS